MGYSNLCQNCGKARKKNAESKAQANQFIVFPCRGFSNRCPIEPAPSFTFKLARHDYQLICWYCIEGRLVDIEMCITSSGGVWDSHSESDRSW